MTALALTLIVSMAPSFAETEVPVPSLEECKSIRGFLAGGGWMYRFHSDGSGGIGFGSLPEDHGGFPKGSVDFADLYRSLAPTLRTQEQARMSGKRGWFHVTFETAGEGEQYTTLMTLDSEALNKAFQQGLNAANPHFANCMEYLLLHSDPFPANGNVLINWLPSRTREESIQQLEAVVSKSADAYEQIGIYTRTGWKLTINPDGSGKLSIGRHPGLTSTIPAKTFDFAQTYESHIQQPLRESLRELQDRNANRLHRRQSYISIAAKPSKMPMSLMIPDVNDLTGVKELFDRAREAAAPPTEPPPKQHHISSALTIDEAWKRNPPVRLPEPSE